jgi:hypothetical protein
MNRRLILFALAFALFPGAIFAQPVSPWMMGFPMKGSAEAGPFLRAEIGRIEADLDGQKMGDIDVSTLFAVRDRLSVASQKDAYVRDMGIHSFLLPGLGQIQTGDTAGGIGFMAADLGVLAGAFVGAYFLLPSDLRFDRIDYFGSSVSAVHSAWTSHSVTEYLPAFAAFMAGMVLDQTLRHWSAAIARREAASTVEDGRVSFTPRVGIGFMGFDIAW